MPAYFRLIPKGDPENKPSTLEDVDKQLCRVTGKPLSETRYCLEWYTIGLSLACGKTFAEMRSQFMTGCKDHTPDDDDVKWFLMINYLEHYYDVECGHAPK